MKTHQVHNVFFCSGDVRHYIPGRPCCTRFQAARNELTTDDIILNAMPLSYPIRKNKQVIKDESALRILSSGSNSSLKDIISQGD